MACAKPRLRTSTRTRRLPPFFSAPFDPSRAAESISTRGHGCLKARRPAGASWGLGMAGAVQAGHSDRTDEPTAGKPDGSLGRFAIRPANGYLSAISMELRYGCLDAVDRTC
jgi:hypothetical protein